MKIKLLSTFALFFSVFSILSSLSLIGEINKVGVEWYIALFLTVFLVVFILFNEYIKIKELRLKFNNSTQHNFFMLLVTFTISLSTSTMGIYLWTDKTQEINSSMITEQTSAADSITALYNSRINSLYTSNFSDTPEGKSLESSLSYWKSRKAANSEDLQSIRLNVSRIEQQRSGAIEQFNVSRKQAEDRLKQEMNTKISSLNSISTVKQGKMSRNNRITFIFMVLVLITEFMIVFSQKELCNPNQTKISKEYYRVVRLITNLSLRGFMNRPVDINEVKFSEFMREYEWDEVKRIFNLLIEIGVIDQHKSLSPDCISKVQNYYKQMLKLV